MSTTTYTNAVAAVRAYSEAKQTELDLIATEARAACISAVRAACTAGVAEDSPAYPVCALLAQTISMGRECDGYPGVTIPLDTQRVLSAAAKAGILARVCNDGSVIAGSLRLYRSCEGVNTGLPAAHHADYLAWDAARTYRQAQTWATL